MFGATAMLLSGTALAASGDQLWVARYNDPKDGSDTAQSMAVSPDGTRVFVTGTFHRLRAWDYATVAYDSASGHRLWVASYDGPIHGFDDASSIAVSPDGARVFVTGDSAGSTSFDYATVAYDAATGQELWVARYNTPWNGIDFGQFVVVSPDGARVFVTGGSTGPKEYHYATMAYDAATGHQLWLARYNSPGGYSNEVPRGMAVSPDGARVFVTGESFVNSTTFDYATVAYDATTGQELWAAQYRGPRWDFAYSIAASPDGARVYVTGYSRRFVTGDYLTIAYNAASGRKVWLARYNGPANDADTAHSVGVSPDGATVFVTGTSAGTNTGLDYATVAYDAATGEQLWVARYGPGQGGVARSLAVSQDGATVFVTGYNFFKRTTNYNYATVAYEAATGHELWAASYDGPANGEDRAVSLAFSPVGPRVFVTGFSTGSTTGYDYATVAYRA